MKNLTELQSAVLEIINQHPKGNAITGREIVNFIHLKQRDNRKEGADMRSIIHALRAKGYPICATDEGYWFASTSGELSEYITSFQGRIDKQQMAVDALKNSFCNVGKIFYTAKPEDKVASSESQLNKLF